MPSVGHVFVYGTLLHGEPNHHLMAGAPIVEHDAVVLGFELLDLGAFPGAVRAPFGRIEGEVYRVSAGRFEQLDRLEGVPYLYQHARVVTEAGTEAVLYELVDGRSRKHAQPMGPRWRDRRRRGA